MIIVYDRPSGVKAETVHEEQICPCGSFTSIEEFYMGKIYTTCQNCKDLLGVD